MILQGGDHHILLKMKERGTELIANKEIIGSQVILRSALESDAEFTLSIRKEHKDKTQYVHALDGTIADQKKWLTEQINKDDSYFMVFSDLDGKLFGTYGIYDIDFNAKSAELGRAMLVGNPIQNLEAIYLIHEFAYNDLGLDVLFTDVFEDNTSAVGVNRQVGGVVIGQEFNDEFKLNNLRFEITKENYYQKRDGIKRLVDRFGKRK